MQNSVNGGTSMSGLIGNAFAERFPEIYCARYTNVTLFFAPAAMFPTRDQRFQQVTIGTSDIK